jgi:hypothetical protein
MDPPPLHPTEVILTLNDLFDTMITSDEAAHTVWEALTQNQTRIECVKDDLVAYVDAPAHFVADNVVLQATHRKLMFLLETLSHHTRAMHATVASCIEQQELIMAHASNLVVYGSTAALSRRVPEEPGREGHAMFVPHAVDLANPTLGAAANNVQDNSPLYARIGTTFS